MIKYIVCVLGATSSGKTTFIEFAKRNYPEIVDSICVGKILRQKYPPEYFEGRAVMDKTEDEVRGILEESIKRFTSSDYSILMIDGQPRSIEQTEFIESLVEKYELDGIRMIWVDCTEGERQRRGESRSQSPGELELFNSRKVRDKIDMFSVLFNILDRCYTVITCDTSAYNVEAEFTWSIRYILKDTGLKP